MATNGGKNGARAWAELFLRHKVFFLIVGVIILLWVTNLLPDSPAEAKEWIDSVLDYLKETKQ
jgi:hypothetical protein